MQLRIKKAFMTGAIAAGLVFMAWSDFLGKEEYVQYVIEHWIEWDSFSSLVAYGVGLILVVGFLARELRYRDEEI